MSTEVRIGFIGVFIFVAGISIGLFTAALIVTSKEWVGEDSTRSQLYEPKYDMSFMSYEGGTVNDKSQRHATRGEDWIIIKDFPTDIDLYWETFSNRSTELWGYSPSFKKIEGASQ